MKQTEDHSPGALERLFGAKSATARVLDFMSTCRRYDYNKKDIADNSNLSQKHVKFAIEKLEQLNLIKQTRTIGNAILYQYNTENQAADLLEKFKLLIATCDIDRSIAEQEAQEQTQQQQPTQTEAEAKLEAELLTTPA